jgi:hypothetical protein
VARTSRETRWPFQVSKQSSHRFALAVRSTARFHRRLFGQDALS